jgi:hypothetical protein
MVINCSIMEGVVANSTTYGAECVEGCKAGVGR